MAEMEGREKPQLDEQPVAPPAPQPPASQDDPTVETAEEAVEPPEADINELCKDMFNKMSCYLTGELLATCEDYKLLENMNKLTCLKYMEIKDISENIRNLKDLNKTYASLQPYLEQINQIEEQVASLENAAYKLDAYSKRLEAKFKKLEKRVHLVLQRVLRCQRRRNKYK
ncbi:biogenesis of lysosome-related organelles complex 1 subunit 2-like [Pelobates fuscus]|uniref:biogenesis of lysosome-related organelles complex 1 subunit 2-like n=1 Tax=Pelobates fuscus TaxID=191477 RepID=UPI002FE4DB12